MADNTPLPSEHIEESTSDTNAADYEALKAFLLDISCLDPLSEWTDRFNLFDVLKISHYEIRHSNFLAWLLNPKETHGLGSFFLEGFIKHALSGLENKADVFKILLMDFQSFTVFREWHNIDILAVSVNEKVVICIENKYGAKEHGNQLEKYHNTVLGSFPDYKKIFVFLSPDGMESSCPEYWCPMSYEEILSIIENAEARTVIRPEAQMLIHQYKESVRREIMGDEKLVQICRKIYSKHQKALDLLFENRPDKMSEVSEVFRSWAKNKMDQGVLVFDGDHSNKIYTRMKTARMDAVIPDISANTDDLSGWGSKSSYYYEIHQEHQENDSQYRFKLVVNATNMSAESLEACELINRLYKMSSFKEKWQWRTYFSTKRRTVGEDISEESIFQSLDQLWNEIMEQEDRIVAACQNKSEIPSASND